jgi:tRNA pseudouridine55 synthase
VDGVILLDKPLGVSSNHALQAVRRLFNAEKAGHTGTLDPLATGLLPICLGQATKFSSDLLDADKLYRASIRLGAETTTGDAEGEIVTQSRVSVDLTRVEQVLAQFLGEIEQVPPMHSALKRDGKPLYVYARAGIELEREPRRVMIRSLGLQSFGDELLVVDVECSKGTYIRTLAQDIGRALGCGAHLAGLRRLGVGRLVMDQAISLDALEHLSLAERDARLLPVDLLVSEAPAVTLSADNAARYCHGQSVRVALGEAPRVRVYSDTGAFIGLGCMQADGRLHPTRVVAGEATKSTSALS